VTGVNLNELPPQVLFAARSRAADGQIAYVNKETWGDRVVYIVSFKDEKRHPRLHITSDGTVLNEGPK